MRTCTCHSLRVEAPPPSHLYLGLTLGGCKHIVDSQPPSKGLSNLPTCVIACGLKLRDWYEMHTYVRRLRQRAVNGDCECNCNGFVKNKIACMLKLRQLICRRTGASRDAPHPSDRATNSMYSREVAQFMKRCAVSALVELAGIASTKAHSQDAPLGGNCGRGLRKGDFV